MRNPAGYEAMSESELLSAIGAKLSESRGIGIFGTTRTEMTHDPAACDELLRRHYAWLSRLCFVEVRASQDALEGLQEALIEIARSLPSFDGRSSIRTWMYVVAKRTLRRYRRRGLTRAQRFPLGAERDVAETSVPSTLPQTSEELLVESEEKQRLLRLVRELPDKQRHAIFFHYFEDLSVEESAARLGCSEGSVKTHLFRGRQKLKELLEREG